MRRVLFVNRFYWPDLAATGQLLTELAEDLADRGWDVTVLTGRSDYRGAGSSTPLKEDRRGVRVVRVRGTSFGRGRTLGRLADYVTFYLGAMLRVLLMPRFGVIVAMSDPPLLHVGCSAMGRLRGTPVVSWTQDVYPELALRLGVFPRRNLLYRLLDKLARSGHRRCDMVVVVGDRMADVLEKRGVDRKRIADIPNWTDTSRIVPVPPEGNRLLREAGLEGRFVVLYSGNAGSAHTFDGVLDAATRLESEDVAFVFAGAGTKMTALREHVAEAGPANVVFRGYVEKHRLAESLSMASVALVTQDPAMTGLLVPSKLYPILAVARPVLFVGPADSEVADVIREHGCGAVVEPGAATAMVDWICRMKDDPEMREAAGRRARAAAEAAFDRPEAAARWDDVLGAVVRRGGRE